MADTISNPGVEPLFLSLDPMSLLLSQNSDAYQLRLTVDSFLGFERGPRYGEYARLREAKLRVKRDFEKILEEEEKRFSIGDEPRKKITATKQVRFGGDLVVDSRDVEKGTGDEVRVSPEKKEVRFKATKSVNSRKSVTSSTSMLAQSVPDFSAMIRKENRRPANINALPRTMELTPPPSKSKNAAVFAGSASSARGSKSTSAGEKKSKGIGLARKSYASVEDLKKISMAAATAINGGGGGGVRRAAGGGRTVLGYRQLH